METVSSTFSFEGVVREKHSTSTWQFKLAAIVLPFHKGVIASLTNGAGEGVRGCNLNMFAL